MPLIPMPRRKPRRVCTPSGCHTIGGVGGKHKSKARKGIKRTHSKRVRHGRRRGGVGVITAAMKDGLAKYRADVKAGRVVPCSSKAAGLMGPKAVAAYNKCKKAKRSAKRQGQPKGAKATKVIQINGKDVPLSCRVSGGGKHIACYGDIPKGTL